MPAGSTPGISFVENSWGLWIILLHVRTTAVNTTSDKVFLVDKLHRLPCESRSQISLTISKYLWFWSLQKEIFRTLGDVDRICIVMTLPSAKVKESILVSIHQCMPLQHAV